MSRVFIAVPTYDGRIDFKVTAAVDREAGLYRNCVRMYKRSSLLANCFNFLYATCLNAGDQFKYFLLWHSDIVPERGAVSKMVEIARAHDLHVLSAAVPIRDAKGLYSCGLEYRLGGSVRRRRLVGKELFQLPEVFHGNHVRNLFGLDNGHLLINSGLLLINQQHAFKKEVCFSIRDAIVRDPVSGKYVASVDPEDWGFSRFCELHGSVGESKYACTRAVKLLHYGEAGFSNAFAWGEWDSDQAISDEYVPEDDMQISNKEVDSA